MNVYKQYYYELRDDGYSHAEIVEEGLIDKSDRTLFRYQAAYLQDNAFDIVKNMEKPTKDVYVWSRKNYSNMNYPWQVDPNTIKEQDRVYGVLPDIHTPFTKWKYIEQAINIFLEFGVNVIVNIGDLADKHTFSRYENHPEALGTMTEFDMAKTYIDKLAEVFPYMHITPGNHDLRSDAQAAKAGIPKHFLKSDAEAYGYPDTWYVAEYFELGGVIYEHGTATGMQAHQKAAMANFQSTVVGHAHTNFGVSYIKTKKNDLIMGMGVGCLIDRESYAFSYSKSNVKDFILGVGIVIDEQLGFVVPVEA